MNWAVKNHDEAYHFLEGLNAPEPLMAHVKLVWEAGSALLCQLQSLGVRVDGQLIEVGIALHDVGKVVHRNELHEPGSAHEVEGEKLLLAYGAPIALARICVAHGRWAEIPCSLEELVVALADKLWKGKRVAELELLVVDRVAAILGVERWDVFVELDHCFEGIAEGGDGRLLRSR